MKKMFMFVLLLLASMLLFTGCGGALNSDSTSDSDQPDETTDQPDTTIDIAQLEWRLNAAPLLSVIYDGERYIAVGWFGTILNSEDGATWQLANSVDGNGSIEELLAVAYGNGRYVTVGYSFDGGEAPILTSTDGVNWEAIDHLVGEWHFNDVIFGDNMFVATSLDKIYVSTDGVDWEQVGDIFGHLFWAVAYGGGIYAVAGEGTIVTSTDGHSWTEDEVATDASLYAITYGGGRFVVVGYNYTIDENGTETLSAVSAVSEDGSSWQVNDVGQGTFLRGVVYGNDGFLAWGENFDNKGTTNILFSADGGNWEEVASLEGQCIRDITYAENSYLAVADCGPYRYYTSQDGRSWSPVGSAGVNNAGFFDVIYGDDRFVASGFGGIAISSDGLSWQGVSEFGDISWLGLGIEAVTYGDGVYLAVGVRWLEDGGRQGVILRSSDGESWAAADEGLITNEHFKGIAYGGGKYVAVGDGGIYSSENGDEWNYMNGAGARGLYSVTASNTGKFVAVGGSGVIFASDDGDSWTFVGSEAGADYDLTSVTVSEDGRFVAVGTHGVILTSTDGENWEPVSSGTEKGLWGVAYVNDKFVAVGVDGTVLVSDNGLEWELLNTSAGGLLTGVAFGNNRYVVAGGAGIFSTP